jgi:hypothetical protein
MELPCTKQEIIDAVIAGYRPVDVKDSTTWATLQCIGIFAHLALGRPEGRQAPYAEDELHGRIVRVWTAIKEGRDPNAAYDVPLPTEQPLTTDDQLSKDYRVMAELLNAEDTRRRQQP